MKNDICSPIEGDLQKKCNNVLIVLSAILVVYILYTKLTFPPQAFYDRLIYMAVSLLMLCCIQLPAYSGARRLLVIIGTVLSLSACIYMFFNVPKIMGNMYRADWNDGYVYVIYFIGVLILLQDSLGGKIVGALGLMIMVYLFFGNKLSGVFKIPPLNIKHIATMAFTDTDQGAFGTFLAVMARVLSVFLLFSSLLVATGLGDLIRAVSMLGTGKSKGGPAKVAVVASALFGMISGSPVANVAATGCFTIPLMKSIGYKPTTAGAIETVASTGGNITPPIMGLSAFIMCEILGVSYTKVMLWGVVPAILWYYSTFLFVHFSALSQDVKSWTPEREELVQVLKSKWHLLISIVILVFFLVKLRVAEVAALYSLLSLFVISFFRKETRLDILKLKEFFLSFANTFAGLTLLNTMLGIFTAGLLSTGTHSKLIHLVFGGISHWFVISLIVFGLCVLFGMVVPPFAAYIAIVTIAAPLLRQAGFELPVIHMFVMYACTLAPITPPVAVAAYTAASIAGADALKTASEATIQALPLWIFPFLMLQHRLFLGMGTKTSVLIGNLGMIMFGVLLFVVGINRYWTDKVPKQWVVWIFVLVLLIMQPLSMAASVVACVLGVITLTMLHLNKNKKITNN